MIERIDYFGVAFGLTPALLGFWANSDYRLVYIRQEVSETTCEHTAVALHNFGNLKLINQFYIDFRQRFYAHLATSFRNMSVNMAFQIMN